MSTRPTVRDPEQTFAWELRGHWAKRRRVILIMSDRCMVDRIEGTVTQVAVTGAFAIVDDWHVPLAEVVAIHRPHFHQRDADIALRDQLERHGREFGYPECCIKQFCDDVDAGRWPVELRGKAPSDGRVPCDDCKATLTADGSPTTTGGSK